MHCDDLAMKRLLIFLLFSLSCFCSYGQNDKLAKQFIRSLFEQKKIIYTSSVTDETIKEITAALKPDMIYSNIYILGKVSDSIMFSKEEKSYINNQIEILKSNKWTSGLVENSTFIDSAALKKIIIGVDGWKNFHKHYGTFIYRFSKPIFLRNNTMCIFYFGYFCDGLCGYKNLSIYSKKGDQWQIGGFNLFNEIN